jgi:lysophospholipase L1-like esterase
MTGATNRRCFVAALAFVAAALGTNTYAQLAPAADRWEPEIHAFELADRAKPPTPGGVVFIGSSSIRMWKSLSDDFPNANALNRGFGGSRIADSTRFVPRIVTPLHPRLVVLYAGDNDIVEGASAKTVLADFKAFVAAVRNDAPTTPIVFISIKPSPSRVHLIDTMRDANASVRAYAATQAGIRYVDVFDAMLGQDGQPRKELFGPDGLHMNAAGYRMWVSILTPELARR